MAEHITKENHNIHSFDDHAIQTVTWTGTTNIDIYDTTSYNGASVVAKITDGTNVERILVECGHDGTDTVIDATHMLISGNYFDLTITSSLVSSSFRLTIVNSDAVATNTLKYYTVPSSL